MRLVISCCTLQVIVVSGVSLNCYDQRLQCLHHQPHVTSVITTFITFTWERRFCFTVCFVRWKWKYKLNDVFCIPWVTVSSRYIFQPRVTPAGPPLRLRKMLWLHAKNRTWLRWLDCGGGTVRSHLLRTNFHCTLTGLVFVVYAQGNLEHLCATCKTFMPQNLYNILWTWNST